MNTKLLPDGEGELVGLDNDLVAHFPVTELENNTKVTTIQSIERFEFSIYIAHNGLMTMCFYFYCIDCTHGAANGIQIWNTWYCI